MAKPTTTNKPASNKEKLSLADLFDGTDSSEASNRPSPGQHEVRMSSIELKKDPKKGAGVFINYDVIEGEEEGKSIRQMYKLTDADGNKCSGMGFLKRDLELLGHKEVSGAKLEKLFKEMTEEQPMVVINVVENGQYVNAYLMGVADGVTGGKDSDPDPEPVDLNVGDDVTWVDDQGDEQKGTIAKIKKDQAIMEDGEKVDLSELKPAEAEEEAAELKIGDQVTDGTVTGKIKKIADDVATVLDSEGDRHKIDLSDLKLVGADEPEAEKEKEEKEIEVGSQVTWNDDDGDPVKGEVIKIKKDKVTVKDEDDDEQVVDLADLELVEEEEEEEKPKAKGKKK